MKLTSLAVLSLLAALSFAPSSLASSDPYVVSGVKYDNPWASEFYFDSTKGSTLVNYGTSVNAFIEAWKQNAKDHDGNVKDLTFLGEWAGRIDKSSTWFSNPTNGNGVPLTAENIDASAVDKLVNISGTSGDTGTRSDKGMSLDGSMCWAHTAANMLQYWQCYYGIFATNTSAMQHGYAVKDGATAKTMLGVQSLNTTKWFYDHFTNNGAELPKALGLYLDYDANYSDKSLQVFGDYFSSSTAATIVKSAGTIEELTTHVLSLMGVDKADNGSLSSNTYGQLIGLDIAVADRLGSGHSLTMYGFGLDETGQINRLIYADSNVASADGLRTVYVKENNGALVLYEDSSCQKLLEGEAWQISKLTAINTPDSLKDMRRQYDEGDLVWKGGNTWTAGQGTGSMATAMPTDATGWQVSVNGAYYNSYFDASRNVRFNDDGNPGGEIKISGTAKAHNMTIDAVSKDYTFNAKTSAADDSIALTGDLIKSGAANASFGLNISAAGLSVKGGTLAVGSGCALTISGTSMIERGATLSMAAGGAASLGRATFAAGSVLSVSGTKNTLNASSLTFADGARLSFDLSNPDAKSNTMLTIIGTPNFGGKVYFDFAHGEEKQTYHLIYFGSSVNSNCLENFVSYNGNLSLNGNYLTLTYKQEQSATWNGSSGTWSAATTNWKDTESPENAASPEKSVVNFTSNTETQTVTISGTVNPSAIKVTGGSYVFESDADKPGSISGSRDLTVSGTGTSLTAQLNLGNRAVKVQDTASFVYEVADAVQLAGLEVATGASATFQGSGTYDVYNPSVIGSLNVKGTAQLALHSDASVSKDINLTMTENASVQFRNTSNSGMVSYSLATNPSTGTIHVGSADDTFGTRLNVSSAATTYTVARDSILSIGKATAAFTASGEGTVLVDSDKASAYLSVTSGYALKDVNLHIAGTATMSCSETGLQLASASGKEWTVSGTLNLELTSYDHTENSAPVMSLSRLHLDGGTLSGKMGVDALVSCKVDELNVTQKGGSITWAPSSTLSGGAYTPTTVMEIDRLRAEGTLQMTMTGSRRSGMFLINETDCLSGIELRAGDSGSTSACDQVLQLNGGEIKGGVKLTLLNGSRPAGAATSVSTWNNHGHIVVSSTLRVGGLDSALDLGTASISRTNGYDSAHLQGGVYNMSSKALDQTGGPVKLIIETHDDSHTFTGHIGNNIDILKQGAGSQELIGDLSAFNGSISVERGSLVMSRDSQRKLNDGTSIPLITLDNDSNSTTLKATSLSISGGATLESNLTVKVSGAFMSKAYVSDLVGTAAAETLLLGDAVGTTATTNPVASLTADTDLREVSSLDMETTVDLGGKSLTLWSGRKELTLSDSMFELQTDGTYKVTLFTNIGTLTGLDSDFVSADTKFTTQQGWLSDGVTLSKVTTDNSTNLVLANIQYIPEPTTATLALLGLMGLCARRRRKK
ncbi:MAG: PEP-CTERM sorting domain-containing protein [Akkermansia muciniphila]|nr:PEP-CTERM sorting domain-containing protein [Akkermansia muciniphila]